MGLDKEARAALAQASSIAQRPNGSNKELAAEIKMIKGRLELSLLHFRESQDNSRQALNLAGTEYKDIAIQARSTLGLALARSGELHAGSLLCEQAVDMAALTGDPQLLSGALLASAEAMLENGDPQRALEIALQTQASFARFGQQDSEWHAWLIAALATERTGDATARREYASQADIVLSNLTQKWGVETYHSYLARLDVQRSRKQLGQVLKPQS
jgi:ATP/maltotriose-dependent transcriptional regulator MalT